MVEEATIVLASVSVLEDPTDRPRARAGHHVLVSRSVLARIVLLAIKRVGHVRAQLSGHVCEQGTIV